MKPLEGSYHFFTLVGNIVSSEIKKPMRRKGFHFRQLTVAADKDNQMPVT